MRKLQMSLFEMRFLKEFLLIVVITFILSLIILMSGCSFLKTKRVDGWVLKYNYLEKNYQYAPEDAQLKWNYMEKKYEFAR